MRIFPPILALAAVLTLSNCSSSSTPAGRIEKNPQIYNELSLRQQELVSQGQIAEGLPPGGVYLALGAPERRLEGSAEGKKTMRWDYTTLSPVYTSSFGFGTGFGHGGFGRRGFGRGGFGRGGFGRHGGFGSFGSSVTYIPSLSSTVWFENDRVRSYERVR